LISGSTVADFVSTVQGFCAQYDQTQWNDMLRLELPDLTDEDIAWLSTMAATMSRPIVNGGQKKQEGRAENNNDGTNKQQQCRARPSHTPDVGQAEG
jgi:hypothetical protein